MVVQAFFLHIFAVIFIRLSLLLIVQISIPVGIKIQHFSALFQYTIPLFISLLRFRKIPCKISGNHHIEGFIRKRQLLGIHPLKTDILTQCSCVFFCFFQHSFRIIHRIHMVACLCQNHRKETRTCSNIQYPNILFCFLREFLFQHRKPCFFLQAMQLLLIYLRIAFRSGAPIAFYLIL